MEGKSETVRSAAIDDNRIDSVNIGSSPVSEPFGEILKTLGESIKKAEQVEKAVENAKQEKQLRPQQHEQSQNKTKHRSHEHEYEHDR